MTIILSLLRDIFEAIAKEDVFMKKKDYDKTDFFWSLYCKFLLATCWIGGFLFGCVAWLKAFPYSLNCFGCVLWEELKPSFLNICAEFIPLAVGCLVSCFLQWPFVLLHIFIRTSLFAFCMLNLFILSDSTVWAAILFVQFFFLSFEFLVFSKFAHHSCFAYSHS